MAIAQDLPRRITKSTLSQYLRTKCDRQLFFSLHEDKVLEAAGLPVPMPARPGVGVLRSEGQTFEEQRNARLIAAFGSSVVYAKGSTGLPKKERLETLLAQALATPSILLQGKIEPTKFRKQVLDNFGLDAAQQARVPAMDGHIPDIVVVRAPQAGDEAVTPVGGRRSLSPSDHSKRALVVIDVKHTSEANPSYSAEVALYAVMLANWLQDSKLDDTYYVALNCALWTRFKEGDSAFEAALAKNPKPPEAELLANLMSDCEDANLRFYLPTVLRFFREDLQRVITTGSATSHSWKKLEWHVDSRCSSCDYLGYARWVPTASKALLEAHPEHYCHPNAELTEHLSRIPGMTRGGRKTLQIGSVATTAAVAASAGTEPVYEKHTFLKREGPKLPARAKALAAQQLDVDSSALLATLAPYPHLSLSVAVNFDPSSGLLTGLGMGGGASAYVKGQKPLYWKHQGFVVDQKSLQAEWNELCAFLSAISDFIGQADDYVSKLGKGPLKGQFVFWEARQYEELCNAVGRHLPKVLALADKKQRALAWMFPPEELMEKDAGAVPPCVVFLDEIVRRVVFSPVPHVITLFDTAENYHAGEFSPVERDAFYREFLTNGIPRERIYEIWSNEPQIVRGKQTKSRNTVITEYNQSLAKQSGSIASIAQRLRTDFKGQIKATNPEIDLSIPLGATKVAFDAKLWIWWDKLNHATDKAAGHQRLALDGRTLEASYEALRLFNGVRVDNHVWDFEVRAGSTESKIEEGQGFLAVCSEAIPGLPLNKAGQYIPAATYPGNTEELMRPLWSVLNARVLTFDRVKKTASVAFDAPSGLFSQLVKNNAIDVVDGIFLTPNKPFFDWSKFSTAILKQVGNPPIATADPAAAHAMGQLPKKPGTAPLTPLAELLWAAPAVQQRQVLSSASAAQLADEASALHGLNPSQRSAVAHALERGLSVIWGPPGTGKTKTLAAYVHALARDAAKKGEGLNVLLTGPTYKAVEEVVGRVIKLLDADPTCPCDVFICYSSSQVPKTFEEGNPHLNVASNDIKDEEFSQGYLGSLMNDGRITIVATSVMQCHKFASALTGQPVGDVFDAVVLDESSQVEVTKAISALGTMKQSGRAVIAGDHLQMPPIAALEAPVGAEHLVGSIQRYLLRRAFGSPVTSCDLIENYRSHEDIVGFARGIGYPSSLSAHYPGTALRQLAPLPTPTTGFPGHQLPYWPELIKMVAPKPSVMTLLHDDDLSSLGNEVEAALVASLVWSLRNTASAVLDGQPSNEPHALATAEQFWEKSVGIVTPHRAQRALVIRELQRLYPDEARLLEKAVDTVEKFQGGERHTVIVSFGVADADVIGGEEAFLMQLERTNVAISRAQAKCIVVMPTSLAGHVPQDKKALLTAHAIKDYVDDFCNHELPLSIQLPDGTLRNGKLRYRG